jgi:hypothetical protein
LSDPTIDKHPAAIPLLGFLMEKTMTTTLTIRRTTITRHVTLDDHDYRVTHQHWAAGKWGNGGETWTVITSHTDRVCDPDKSTHKRVVAAVIASTTAQGGQRA